MKSIVAVYLMISLFFMCNAQQITFSKAIDVGGLEIGWNVFATEDGYYICGNTSLDTPEYHILTAITKTNLEGEVEWVNTHGNPDVNLYPGNSSWEMNEQNEFIVGGSIQYKDGSASQVFLSKFDALGDTVFINTIGIPGFWTIGQDVIKTHDGGYAAIGRTKSGGDNVFLVKVDSLGNFMWQNIYGTNFTYNAGGSIQLGSNGNLYLGCTYNEEKGWLIKIDSLGNILWDKIFEDENYSTSSLYNIIVLENNDIVFSQIVRPGNTVFAGLTRLRRLTSEGDSVWTKMLPFDEYEEHDVRSIRELSNGDIVIAGTYKNMDMSPQILGGWIARMDANGNILWTRRYKYEESPLYPIHAYFYDVKPTPDNGFILTGHTVYNDQDIWLVKLDSMGCLEPGCHIDTSDTVGVIDISPQYLQSKVYPNPFSGQAVIEVALDGRPAHDAICRIYDIQGKVVKELKTKADNQETLTYRLDKPMLQAGIYFYKVVSKHEVIARGKLVKE
ncbi:MAG: T9SS C-terminal target domain-containing protein [Chitinophagaceae bacterium]|nr:MAG: T9SS C-terminal target domain-containing protein [Chitinophagaceae bacterium]